MPDISMCLNKTCPSKDQCYRFTATPDEHWQSYGGFTPDGDRCEFFMQDRRVEAAPIDKDGA